MILVGGVGRVDDDREMWIDIMHTPEHIQTVHAGLHKIQHDQVRMDGLHQG